MIEINNELSENLGYSSIRYLKSAITRLFGQSSIIDNHISKDKVIFLAGKRNKIILLDILKPNSNEVYNKAKELAYEINIRHGISNEPYFYGDCDNIGAILYDMYRNNEITKSEFIDCIINNNINISINIAKFKTDENYELEVSSEYSNYSFESKSYSFSKTNKYISKNDEYDIPVKTINDIECLISWDDSDANLCFYNKDKLIGSFRFKYPSWDNRNTPIDFDNMMLNVKELFLFDNIKEDYTLFINTFKKDMESLYYKVISDHIKEIKLNCTHKYKYKKCEFYYKQNTNQVQCDIINDGNHIKTIYIDSKFGDYDFSKYAYEKLKEDGGLFDSLCINQAIEYSKTKEVKYERTSYSNYDYKSLMSSTPIKEEDRKFYKNIYRNLSKIYHPDVFTGDGGERYMQLVNDLKTQWGI